MKRWQQCLWLIHVSQQLQISSIKLQIRSPYSSKINLQVTRLILSSIINIINEQDCLQLLTRFVVLIQFPFDQPPSIKFAQNQCPKCSVHYCCEDGSHKSWIITRITMGSQLHNPICLQSTTNLNPYPKNSDCHQFLFSYKLRSHL